MSASAGLAAILLDLLVGGTLRDLPLTEGQLVHTGTGGLWFWLWIRLRFGFVFFGCGGLCRSS